MNAAILMVCHRAAKRGSFFGKWMFCFWAGEMFQMFAGDILTFWRVLPVYFWVLAQAAREAGERLNILLVDQFGEMGGAQRCLVEAAMGFAERGWEVRALVPDGPISLKR